MRHARFVSRYSTKTQKLFCERKTQNTIGDRIASIQHCSSTTVNNVCNLASSKTVVRSDLYSAFRLVGTRSERKFVVVMRWRVALDVASYSLILN